MSNARFQTRIFSAAAVLVLLLCAPAGADIYRWVDETGTIHFTDDLSNIPAQYRGKQSVTIREAPKPPAPAAGAPEVRQAPVPSSDDALSAFSGGEGSQENSIERLKSKIAAKDEFMKRVEERQNLIQNPDRRRVLDPGDLELYNKYKEELPKDRERLRELEPSGE